MQRIDGEILFSPHDLINFMQCEFITWMDRRYLDDRGLQPDEDDDSVKIIQRRGIEHEADFLKKLREQGLKVIDIADGGTSVAERLEMTRRAMVEGYDVIYQAQLSDGVFAGIADFLHKVPGDSAFGNYHYDVRDTKLAKKAKPEFLIQLACYADLLQGMQGRLPERVAIVLGSGETEWFRTEDYLFYYRSLKRAFLRFVARFDSSQCPDDVRELPFSRWNTEAARLIAERDLLVQVANIRKLQIRRLRECGINTMRELAESNLQWIPKMGIETFATLKKQARLQIASRSTAVPAFELVPSLNLNECKGLALIPPNDPLDVWFDMEGYPHVEGGLEYLFGATHVEADGRLAFTDFWAHDRDSEKKAFEQFVDWIYARFQKSSSMRVYHYASYEVSALRRLMGRHGTREREVDTLLRNDVFVDLYQVVRHSLLIGEPSYSIKYIEHLYRGKREGGVATATDSIVFYERWLADPDGSDWHSSKVLNDIREYNRADCESTLELTQWLRERQKEGGISYIAKPIASSEEKEEVPSLAQQMLDDPTNMRLLAHLLDFHKREAKPFWWNVFDRIAMTQEELILDGECIGGLARTGTAAREYEKRVKWIEYEYQFDSTQDTKLNAGSKCCMSYDMNSKTEIVEIDREKGLLWLKFRAEDPQPAEPFGLLPFEPYNTAALQTAIRAIVEEWNQTRLLPKALSDFLSRTRPNTRSSSSRLIDPVKDLEAELLNLLLDLDKTTLCIQGPPGSGKTTIASRVIRDLLAKGCRIGITSNSHKSIENLLNRCADYATSQGVTVVGAKIGADGDGKDGLDLHPTVKFFSEKLKVFPPEDFNLIGGTAYAFCIEQAIDAFDYLFVDEAGQMSVANLVAMSRSAKNIILLGDQMQLEQPVQGFHPEESGMSTLEYYMGNQSTIDEDRGVFLDTTYRMHPGVCSLISDAVYEGKLHSAPEAAKRVLTLPPSLKYITKQAGVIFVPVDHEGNSQCSQEEAACIRDVVNELLQCATGKGKLTLNDILIVAPYNAQVRCIRDLLPPGARVASVDKFQGQEAPVVILSMCSSDANASPRGLPFIFSRSRLNVAISRAQSLAVVVASPKLAHANCTQVEHIALANFFCRIMEYGKTGSSSVDLVRLGDQQSLILDSQLAFD